MVLTNVKNEKTVKRASYFLLSLFMAAAFCLLLVLTEVITFNGGKTAAELKPTSETVFTRTSNPANTSQNVTKDAVQANVNQESSIASGNSVLSAASIEDNKRFVHNKALAFLKEMAANGHGDMEDRFYAFLTLKLHVKPEHAGTLVRMSFWKNFVTLQQSWLNDDYKQAQKAFKLEKELKQAGFAAKGLTLMTGAVQDAEKSLQKIKKGISSDPLGGEQL